MSRSLSLLRNRYVASILLSNVFSQFGIWVRNLAVLLEAMKRTGGDAFAVSMISVAEYAPIFAFSFIGGVFADRWRPKKTVVRCEILSAISVFAVLGEFAAGSWQAVFAATLVSSILSQFAQPSGMKLFKQHVRDEDAQICMSMLQIIMSVFLTAGPVLGTFVYGQWGMKPALLLTGAAFLLSALALRFIPADPAMREAAEAPVRSSLLSDMADGLRYVWRKPDLLRLSLCFALVGFGVGLISPLGMFVVTERLGLSTENLPWITVPYGVGEMIGGMATFLLAAKVAPARLLALGLLVNGAGILVTGRSAVLWLTMAAQFVLAFLQPAIFIGNNALVMRQTDPAYIGRVTGIRTPLMTGAMLLSMGCAGILKDALSLTGVYALACACFWAGWLAVVPPLRPADSRGETR
ncbi:MFS transporter [Cohnella zeiphila]|uniref:MFS transporter n=1 Tax=Cohnella zeiphila TaxID=2761120 RepID=A0A7X0SSC2_9BACL|nr:MFS transporter [Cohnella zeiphila]MBB6735257.1 MFS transporter [Cohnella zeiphila]